MHADPRTPPPAEDRTATSDAVRTERLELLEHVQAALEPLMIALGLLFLVLLAVDVSELELSEGQRTWSNRAQWAIYAFFVADFALRFAIAPAKLRFLRANWLAALSLAIPFLRPLRALRAARALRSIRLVRLLGGANRGMRVLRRVARGRQFAYVGALTLMVTLLGAVGAWSFDRDAAGASIRTFGDALWWAAALVTTINSGLEAVSPEARVIALLLRLYAVSVFGYVTASIASYLVGREAEERGPPLGTGPALAALSDAVAELRRELEAVRRHAAGPEPPSAAAPRARPGEGADDPAR